MDVIECSFPQSIWSEDSNMTKVLFKHLYRINNRKYNAFTQQMKILTKETFINNNTFSGCLHSKDEVLHAHLNLLEIYAPMLATKVIR